MQKMGVDADIHQFMQISISSSNIQIHAMESSLLLLKAVKQCRVLLPSIL